MKIVSITVVIDTNSDECMYIEGDAWTSKGETTVYISDLVEKAGGRLIKLANADIEWTHDIWPEKLEDALKPAVAAIDRKARC